MVEPPGQPGYLAGGATRLSINASQGFNFGKILNLLLYIHSVKNGIKGIVLYVSKNVILEYSITINTKCR